MFVMVVIYLVPEFRESLHANLDMFSSSAGGFVGANWQ